MSQINQEMANILRTAQRLNEKGVRVYAAADGEADSFLLDREAAKLFESDVFEFSFDSPLELKAQLTRMWEYQRCSYMEEFIDVCLVSAFKFRSKREDFTREARVSAFVYEF